MKVRWLPRFLSITALGVFLALAPGLNISLAGEGGGVPPSPTSPQNPSGWGDDLAVSLYALTLIY